MTFQREGNSIQKYEVIKAVYGETINYMSGV